MSTKILVVDDEPRYLRLIEANLASDGFTVIKAMNGQEAVEKAGALKPGTLAIMP